MRYLRYALLGVLALAAFVGAGTLFRAEALPPIIDLGVASADLTVYGDDAGDDSGRAVASGDINGDGTEDLIIGAKSADQGARSFAGETFVIYGGASLPTAIDLNASNAGLTILGKDTWDEMGWSVAAGDINGDGTEDLIIGARGGDGPGTGTSCLGVGDRCDAGETYVIYGGASLPATIDLNTTSADLTVYGDDFNGFLGHSVAAGDINGDGIDDLILGAPRADMPGRSDAGQSYVIFGGASLPATIDLNSTSADVTVSGADGGDQLGDSVAAGDINGDGTDDLIIGADPPLTDAPRT